LGGWRKIIDEQVKGVPRSMIDWQANDRSGFIAIGTSEKLYLFTGGALVDITPYIAATSGFGGGDSRLTDPFTTSSGSDLVDVNVSSHGLTVDTWVEFANANTFNGIDPNGEWQVVAIIDTDNYTIQVDSAATSSGTGGGTDVDYAHQYPAGADDATAGYGYGAGAYGTGTWDTPRSASDISLSARIWSLDTWGEDLMACPLPGGPIFYWDKSNGTSNRATEITNAPDGNAFILTSAIDRHLIAFGAVPVGSANQDPLVIRWCDQNNFNDWTPDANNTSGERRIDKGSRIVTAINVGRTILFWTDLSVYTMNFVGPPAIFSIQFAGDHSGIAGPLARASFGGVVYWMGRDNFWYYDGQVQQLPSDVRNYVFDDMNQNQSDKFFAGVNRQFAEVWFFYASEGSLDIDRYVIFNPREGHWSIGTLDRTAWIDRGEVFPHPSAMSRAGYLFGHDVGFDADGAPIDWFLETYDLELPAGEEDPSGGPGGRLFRVRRLIPDFFQREENIDVQLRARKYPNGVQVTRDRVLKAADNFIPVKLRGRQIGIRLSGSSTKFWRAGHWRGDIIPHGDR
jgi:hypothetical protein